jgi:Saxitoxin biosynthesis operon protein SxtJ
MGHESFDRKEPVSGSSNRSFGFVFAVVFTIIGLWPWLFGGQVRIWSLVVGAAFLGVACLWPAALAPLNRVWMRFGMLLHRIVSPAVLGVMFFVVVTPMGLVMRALGKDPLRLRFNREALSYWIDRQPPGPPPDTLNNQF